MLAAAALGRCGARPPAPSAGWQRCLA